MSEFANTPENADAMRRLRTVTRRIEVFFEMQLNKLNEAAGMLHQLGSENDAALRMASDLERQRRVFEEEQELENQRLIEAGEKLANAWQELEDKQRQLPKPRHVAQPKPEPTIESQPTTQQTSTQQTLHSQATHSQATHSQATHGQTTHGQTTQHQATHRQARQTPVPQNMPLDVAQEKSETTLFEMKLLQQQVAEHARRYNK